MVELKNSSNQPFFLILGPPNAGKTTLMYRLYSGIFYNTIQVDNRNVEEVRVDNVRLRSINIIEKNLIKEIWEPFTRGCSGIIFIIDISISSSISEGYELFQEIRSLKTLEKLPLLVFANKIDLCHQNELRLMKDWNLSENHQNNAFKIQMVSCKTTQGIIEGMEWLMERTSTFFYIPSFRK